MAPSLTHSLTHSAVTEGTGGGRHCAMGQGHKSRAQVLPSVSRPIQSARGTLMERLWRVRNTEVHHPRP